jgi:hypothetical protein
MEIDSSGRYKDKERSTDPAHAILRQGPGVEALSGDTEETPRQWHEDVYGRKIGADRRHLQERTWAHGTMALDTLHTHNRGH